MIYIIEILVLRHKNWDDWELKCGFYKPYELFVQDDFIVKGEKIIPWLLFKIACPKDTLRMLNYKIIFWSFS